MTQDDTRDATLTISPFLFLFNSHYPDLLYSLAILPLWIQDAVLIINKILNNIKINLLNHWDQFELEVRYSFNCLLRS